MHKVIIIEVNNRHLIVLAEGGEFKKIKKTKHNYQVGQEITIPFLNHDKNSFLSVMFNWKTGTAAVLAIILLFFQVLSPISGQGAYAYVGMNMDPSLELKINEEMQVLTIVSFNEEGHQVLDHLDEWEEKDIAYVTSLIFETCEELGFLKTQEEVLITTTLSEDIPEEKEQEMKERVNEVMNKTAKEKSVEMTTIVMSSKEREKAKKMKISPGHYAIYSAAKKSGMKITKKEVAGKTIEEISEKVGPIKELLEGQNETSASKKEKESNHVYEPPLPVIDQKEEKEKEEVEEKTVTLPVPEKLKATLPVVAITPRQDNNHQEIQEKTDKVKNHPPVKTPDKDVPVPAQPDRPKEGKPKEEVPKDKDNQKEEAHKPPATEPEQKDEQDPSSEAQNNWINIEIIVHGTVITMQIKADSNLVKEELMKKALAQLNQNLFSRNQAAVTPSPEQKQPTVENSSLSVNQDTNRCDQTTNLIETTSQIVDQKAS